LYTWRSPDVSGSVNTWRSPAVSGSVNTWRSPDVSGSVNTWRSPDVSGSADKHYRRRYDDNRDSLKSLTVLSYWWMSGNYVFG
jgi:hypothetical protein